VRVSPRLVCVASAGAHLREPNLTIRHSGLWLVVSGFCSDKERQSVKVCECFEYLHSGGKARGDLEGTTSRTLPQCSLCPQAPILNSRHLFTAAPERRGELPPALGLQAGYSLPASSAVEQPAS